MTSALRNPPRAIHASTAQSAARTRHSRARAAARCGQKNSMATIAATATATAAAPNPALRTVLSSALARYWFRALR